MAKFTDWKPTNSAGVLPNTEDVSQFRYRHYINWQVDLTSNMGIGHRDATGGWKIQINDRSGLPTFEQEVKVTLRLVALGFAGLVLFTWAHLKDMIVTTTVNGQTITESNPSWKFTIGGTEMSEFGILIPGGGSDYTSGMAIITAFWETTIYNSDIDIGSTLKVLYDNWSIGASSRPEYQFSFGEAGAFQIDSTFDSFGYLNSVTTLAGTADLLCQRSLPNHTTREQLAILSGKMPSMAVMGNGVVMLLKNESHKMASDNDMAMYKSMDAMMSFQKADGDWLEGNVTMSHLVALRNGGFLQLGKSAGVFKYIRKGNDGSVTHGAITGANTYKELSAAQADNGVITLINEEGEPIASSSDDGVSFQ